MKRVYLPLLTTIILLFARCGSETPATDPIFDDKAPLKKRIELALDKSYLEEIGLSEEDAIKVSDFYRARGFKPVWANDSLLTRTGEHMQQLLDQPNCIGIPNARWSKQISKQKELITKELLLTAYMGYAVNDLQNGLLDTAKHAMKPLAWSNTTHWEKQVDTVKKWGNWFAGFGASHPSYRCLAAGLYDYAYGKTFSTKTFSTTGSH